MAFYTFQQNNSGGSFYFSESEGVTTNVIIEAHTAEEANSRALDIGIYFDGTWDCECCGYRWNEAWEDDGFEEPGIYASGKLHRPGGSYWYWNDPDTFIHYLDGRLEAVDNLEE